MKTLTPEQFKQKYGEVGMAQFSQKPQEQTKEPGYFSRVGSQIKGQFNEAVQSEQSSMKGTMNPISAGLNIAKNVTGILTAPLVQAPGVRQIGEAFGRTGEAIVNTKIGNKVTDALSNVPEPVLSGTSNLIETAMNLATIEGTARSAKGLYNSGKNIVNNLKTPSNTPIPESTSIPNETSGSIMDRVARLKPTDATKFKDMTGKTHGQYLADTGNFGSPDKIIQNEATKFTNSLKEVDTALEKLPGKFKSAPILEALKGLVEKTKAQSSGGVKAPFYGDVVNLVNKYKSGGLTHPEINLLKRLYEKNVKLGYNKLINADAVARATNIDSALRKWQVNQAKLQGFKNIAELNKQTQISKFIINKLGDQVVGQNGLNSMGLTDWIMLSGGDPTAVGGFLTKKFFSSKAVQAKIAEIMRTAESTSPIKAEMGQSEIKQLPAPKPGSPQSQNFTTPKLPTRSLPDEKGVPKNTTQSIPQSPEIQSKKSSVKSSTSSLKVKGTIPENSVYKQYTPKHIDSIENSILADKLKAVVIDSDTIKKMHPNYDPKKPQILHEESSKLSKQIYNKAVDQDTSGVVKFTGGGSGSGKSEIVLSRIGGQPSVIFDGTMGGLDSIKTKIDYALSKGKKVELHPVYTPPELAALFNKLRGRTVPTDVLVDSHTGFRNTVPELQKVYGDKVKIVPYENKIFGKGMDKVVSSKNISNYINSQKMSSAEVKTKINNIETAVNDYGLDTIKKVVNEYLQSIYK